MTTIPIRSALYPSFPKKGKKSFFPHNLMKIVKKTLHFVPRTPVNLIPIVSCCTDTVDILSKTDTFYSHYINLVKKRNHNNSRACTLYLILAIGSVANLILYIGCKAERIIHSIREIQAKKCLYSSPLIKKITLVSITLHWSLKVGQFAASCYYDLGDPKEKEYLTKKGRIYAIGATCILIDKYFNLSLLKVCQIGNDVGQSVSLIYSRNYCWIPLNNTLWR